MGSTGDRDLKTLRQLIREKGISHKTLREAIDSGKLKAFRLGDARNSRILVRPEDFDAYLERHRVRPDAG